MDRSGIISEQVPDELYPYALENTVYVGHWLHLYYRVNQKLNLALVSMVDIANWKDDLDSQKPDGEDQIRTALGFVPTIEYYPFKDLNIKFYANWVGRMYDYSDYAVKRFGVSDHNISRFSVGFVSPLGIF